MTPAADIAAIFDKGLARPGMDPRVAAAIEDPRNQSYVDGYVAAHIPLMLQLLQFDWTAERANQLAVAAIGYRDRLNEFQAATGAIGLDPPEI